MNDDCSLAAISPGQLFQEVEIRAGVEGGVLPIIEPRAPKFDGAENLHVLAFSRHRDFRWAPYATPGGVERRVLPEAGFVGKYQRPTLRARFFLMLGYVYRCQRSRSAASALANMRFGRCTEKPIS